MKKLAAILCANILFASCTPSAVVNINSRKQFDTGKRYKSVVIAMQNAEHSFQKEWENIIASALTTTCDVSAVQSADLSPKFLAKGNKKIFKEFVKLGIDGIIFTETSSYDESTYTGTIPITTPTFSRSYGTVTGTYGGRSFQGQTNTLNVSSQTTYVPYSSTSFVLTQVIWFVDVRTGRTVWSARADANGHDINQIRRVMLKKALMELYKADIVGSGPCYDNFKKMLANGKKRQHP